MLREEFRQNNILTNNAILQISTGFQGVYVLQVISCRNSLQGETHLCLTDGDLYVGAIFRGKNQLQIEQYDVLQTKCKFKTRQKPIQVQSLKIISKSYSRLLGKPPITLHQYFRKTCTFSQSTFKKQQKKQQFEEIARSKPLKKVKKIPDQKQYSQHSQQPNQFDPPTQRNVHRTEQVERADMIQTQIMRPQKPPQQFNRNLISSQKTQKKQKIQHNKISYTQTYSFPHKKETHNFYISDLYERMPGWKILCRVNYLREFISIRGTKCKMMYLIDQKGDHVKAMYYENNEQQRQILLGKCYSFSQGQISEIKYEQRKYCQITLDPSCKTTEQTNFFICPYSASKIKPYSQLAHFNQEQVSVFGVIKSFQKQEIISQTKRKIKVKGIICHPIDLIQIQFSKFVLDGEEQLQVDKFYALHKFVVFESDNTIKLSSGNRSYFVKINKELINEGQGLSLCTTGNKILQILETDSWKNKKYENLSQIKYTTRTIAQMKTLIHRSDSSLFSTISCFIHDIQIKKKYRACPLCKKMTTQEVKGLWKCFKCSKIVDTIPTFVISLTLSDSSGSFETEAYGCKASAFLGVQSSKLFDMSSQEQDLQLYLSKFSEFLVKVKTQKKSGTQINYILNEVEQGQHKLPLQEIRKRTIEQKLKFEDPWGESEEKNNIIKIQEN